MNKITRKKYNIVNNAFVGVEQEILAYSFCCFKIHSLKQCLKRAKKQCRSKRIKIKKYFLKEVMK